MAYDSYLASVLTGASVNQLRRWAERDLISPEKGHRGEQVWSFSDLVALRSFVYLRQSHTLKTIQTAIGNMRDLMHMTKHPSSYQFLTEGGEIIVADNALNPLQPISAWPTPGQQRLATFADVLNAFEAKTGAVVPLARPDTFVTVNLGIVGGFPAIDQTRIPYTCVTEMIADEPGYRLEDISEHFPRVTPEAALSALKFEARVNAARRAA